MTFEIKLAAFLVVSIGLALLSRASLQDSRSHGFYRFFAWESILILILMNIGYWFHRPFGPLQIASWFLLSVSTYLIVHATILLHVVGKPSPEREDRKLMGIEKTTVLVTESIYRYIRHPIYGALLFLTWGVFFKQPTLITSALTLSATFFLFMTARKEEAENIEYFGAAYEYYMKKSKMFIPWLF